MNGNIIIKIIEAVLLVVLLSAVILAQTGVFNKQYQQQNNLQNNGIANNNKLPQVQGGSCGASGGGCGCGGGASANNVQVAQPININEATASENNGAQEIAISFQNNGYYPNIIKLKKDVPVKMIFDLNTVQGCMRAVQIKALGVNKYLKEGDNVVTFTPKKTGTFTMVCSMGMGKATIVVE